MPENSQSSRTMSPYTANIPPPLAPEFPAMTQSVTVALVLLTLMAEPVAPVIVKPRTAAA